MRRAEQRIRDLVQPLDPMRDDERAAAMSPQPEPGTTLDVEPARSRPRPVRRRRTVLAGAAAVALLGSGLVWSVVEPSSVRSYAATPEPLAVVAPRQHQDDAAKLREIAQRAANSGVPARAAGRTAYIKMKNWYLHSRISNQSTVSVVRPEVRELWRHPDGSGRSVVTAGAPEFRSPQDRRKWDGSSAPDRRTHRWAAGERDLFTGKRPPTDVDELRRWLHQRPSSAPEPLRTVTAVTDLLRNRVLLPQERAAVLRLLAEIPGMHHDGTTTDRAGRPGQAFSLESDAGGLPTRYTVIVDPDDGRFLGHEQMLTTSAGGLNVKIPAVTAYETYLTKTFTAQH